MCTLPCDEKDFCRKRVNVCEQQLSTLYTSCRYLSSPSKMLFFFLNHRDNPTFSAHPSRFLLGPPFSAAARPLSANLKSSTVGNNQQGACGRVSTEEKKKKNQKNQKKKKEAEELRSVCYGSPQRRVDDSQSEGETDESLFALHAEMNETMTTIGQLAGTHPSL